MRILEAFSGIMQALQTASSSPPLVPPVPQIAPEPRAKDDVALAALLARWRWAWCYYRLGYRLLPLLKHVVALSLACRGSCSGGCHTPHHVGLHGQEIRVPVLVRHQDPAAAREDAGGVVAKHHG
jgi:hypothetical protein